MTQKHKHSCTLAKTKLKAPCFGCAGGVYGFYFYGSAKTSESSTKMAHVGAFLTAKLTLSDSIRHFDAHCGCRYCGETRPVDVALQTTEQHHCQSCK